MKSKLKVLLVFSEVTPFSKSGGLGDVGGSLPKALKDMGHDVRIITPQYQNINERKYILRDVIRLQNIEVSLGQEIQHIHVKSAFLPDTKVQVYFIDHKPFFFRKGMYADPKTGKEYADNGLRFALFSKGVLETLHRLHWQPDVIHCNDWQSALVPYYLKTSYRANPFFDSTATLFTVHHFGFQGRFESAGAAALGIDGAREGETPDPDGSVNLLRLGIQNADFLNTVSEQHAVEAQSSPEFGFGLEKLLRSRKKAFSGILNGIDTRVWDPSADKLIPHPYDLQHLEGKSENRKALLSRFGMTDRPGAPVVAMVSRLTELKGLDLVRSAFNDILSTGCSFVVLGQGDDEFQQFFKKMTRQHSGRVGASFDFDESLAHLIFAGSDILLAPSRVEPCGLTQLYGLRYGTVPVVSPTGGLLDTIEPVKPRSEKGTGFVMPSLGAKALAQTLKLAVRTYDDPKTWNHIQKTGMKKDFSWESSVKKYIQLYARCMSLSRP
jgi:starch synthase